MRQCLAAGLCLLSLSCASVSFSPGTPRFLPEDLLGMAHAGSRLSPEEYRLLDDLGAVWMRKTFQWQEIQPEPGVWDFGPWDEYVDSGLRAGKKILAVLAYDVGWIHGPGEPPRRNIPPDLLPLYLRYVERVVERYRGKIHAYEIWNEPNWTFWKGRDEDFFALSRAAAAKIKEIDPAARVVAGSFLRAPADFIRGMFESGAVEKVDAVSFHPYAVNPRGAVGLFDKLKKLLGEYGFSGEIWVTEVGYPTGGWYVTRVSEEEQPAYVMKTLAGLAARGARAIFWYEVFDKYPRGRAPSRLDSELFFGLAYPDYTRKAGAAACALFARHAAGARYRPDRVERVDLSDSVTAMLFAREGAASLILWSDGGGRRVRVRMPGRGRLRHPIDREGPGRPVGPVVELRLESRPVFFRWEEGGDFPGGEEGPVVVEGLPGDGVGRTPGEEAPEEAPEEGKGLPAGEGAPGISGGRTPGEGPP